LKFSVFTHHIFARMQQGTSFLDKISGTSAHRMTRARNAPETSSRGMIATGSLSVSQA
jgi:hypothetical protein